MNLKNYFTNYSEIILEQCYLGKDFNLFEGNKLIKSGKVSSSIILDSNIDLEKLYVIEIEGNKLEVFKYRLYDTKEFNNLFNTTNEMGCIISKKDISFRVFAPTKFKLNLNVFKTGNENDLIKSFNMTKNGGVFETTIDKEYENCYYTYSVFDNVTNKETQVCDPYAKTTGVNGVRAMITDLSNTIKITAKYPQRAFNEAIVYELHTRDLSVAASWNGKDEYRGKFLGLIEENTTFTSNGKTVSTGFDHIKELGVTDVQLLPIFDFFMVDETRCNDETYHGIRNGIFNWGYMGLNFSTLEGSYSTNPYDGLSRVNEFKQVVQKYNENNIGIIMDVVYNHTAFSEESNFHTLVPSYYHRMNADKFSDASACGNETASERFMTRRFIVESLVFLAKEYHLSGFRFDLMQIHDVDTMNLITEELSKIDSSILVYGEPWTGGPSVLDENLQAGKRNLVKMPKVGAFNDEIRDGVKGSVFDFKIPGFVQGAANSKMVEQIKYGIVGGIQHPQINKDYLDSGFWHTSSMKCVNYSSAHDNHTIWDKLTLSSNVSIGERKEMHKQTNAIVLLSQGLAFIHAGAELCRSKPTLDGELEDNSYDSSDFTNKIRWEDKITNLDVFEFHKDLIKFRKDNNCFKLNDKEILNINFYKANEKYISFNIDKYLIIFNCFNDSDITLDKNYSVIMENNRFVEGNKTASQGDYSLKSNGTYILKI